ncbi:MAG: undecaprenyl-diphosphatase UppP [Flavobacteriales bacterium]|nr:undecaprenyl-diphosphatase UppP [Flavobacteriales bacterium]
MNIWDAIILGIIQGLSEFLPVSSSGHLELVKALLGVDVEGGAGLMFTIYLHVGTALATVVVFRNTIWDVLKGLFSFKWNEQTKYALMIVISMIPAGIVGLFFKDYIEKLFCGNVILVGSMLLITAVLLFLADKAKNTDHGVTIKDSFIIGISQAIAIIPGISRSGATISTSVLLGIDRSAAARFSFLMVLPLIFGEIAKDIIDNESIAENTDWTMVIIGTAVAFVVGVAACKWMVKLVQKAQLKWFAYYCIVVGAGAIIWQIVK